MEWRELMQIIPKNESNKRSNLVVATLFIAVIAVFVWYIFSGKGIESEKSTGATNPNSSSPAKKGELTKSVDVENAQIGQISKSVEANTPSNLINDYYLATNMMSYIDAAKLKPKLGGVALARSAISKCARGQDLWNGTRPNEVISGAQTKARAELQLRCQGVIQMIASYPNVVAAMDAIESEVDRDVVLDAKRKLQESWSKDLASNASIQQDSMNAISEIFKLTSNIILTPTDLSQIGGGVIYFDGKRYGGVSQEAFLTAWNFYSIEKSLLLNSSEFGGIESLELCAQTGACSGAAKDRLVSVLSSAKSILDQVNQIYPSLKNALDSNDTNRFKRP